MTVSEFDMYMASLDIVENRITDDNKFPVVKDKKLKSCCYATLELLKMSLKFLKVNIDASKKKE